MDLVKAKLLTEELMFEHNLLSWNFKWNTRKSSAGVCNHSNNTIFLSKPLTLIRDEDMVKDTILHEIAHALVGRSHGHDSVWRKKAIEIGCNGKRCFTDVQLEGRYIAVCPNGHISYKHNKPKRLYSCGKCCKHYNPQYQLQFKENPNFS